MDGQENGRKYTLDELATAEQAAELLGCTLRTVYSYLERGKLPFQRVGKVGRLIPYEAIYAFQAPKNGRPLAASQPQAIKNTATDPPEASKTAAKHRRKPKPSNRLKKVCKK